VFFERTIEDSWLRGISIKRKVKVLLKNETRACS